MIGKKLGQSIQPKPAYYYSREWTEDVTKND